MQLPAGIQNKKMISWGKMNTHDPVNQACLAEHTCSFLFSDRTGSDDRDSSHINVERFRAGACIRASTPAQTILSTWSSDERPLDTCPIEIIDSLLSARKNVTTNDLAVPCVSKPINVVPSVLRLAELIDVAPMSCACVKNKIIIQAAQVMASQIIDPARLATHTCPILITYG
jgi:hypothetical protein